MDQNPELWNPEDADHFIQDELFPSNLAPMAGTSNFLTPQKPQTIKGRERELRENLPDFRVVRSGRRKRSIQAFRQNGSIEIHIPDRLTRKQELELIPEMIQMVLDREAKSRKSDDELMKLASAVLAEHLPDFDLTERPKSITWRSMRERWGSCTTVDRTIRISDRLTSAPLYALKHVILHELIHLRIADHGAEFAALLARDPDRARADAFLEGFELGSSGNSDIYL
jgi:predicted metal-dependent hydrolase